MKKDVRIWMIRKEVKSADVAEALNISRAAVCNWLAGRMKSKRIELYMESIGCPREHMGQEEREEGKAA